MAEDFRIRLYSYDFSPCNPGGSFMVQKMAITSPIPVFKGLKDKAESRP